MRVIRGQRWLVVFKVFNFSAAVLVINHAGIAIYQFRIFVVFLRPSSTYSSASCFYVQKTLTPSFVETLPLLVTETVRSRKVHINAQSFAKMSAYIYMHCRHVKKNLQSNVIPIPGIKSLFLYSNHSTDTRFSWNTRPYEATNHNRSEALNSSRGLAARATSYSRYSSRTGSADIAKSNKEGGVAVIALDSKADNSSFYRNNSGRRARSLHLTSVENPFVEPVVTVPIATQEQQEQWVALKGYY